MDLAGCCRGSKHNLGNQSADTSSNHAWNTFLNFPELVVSRYAIFICCYRDECSNYPLFLKYSKFNQGMIVGYFPLKSPRDSVIFSFKFYTLSIFNLISKRYCPEIAPQLNPHPILYTTMRTPILKKFLYSCKPANGYTLMRHSVLVLVDGRPIETLPRLCC